LKATQATKNNKEEDKMAKTMNVFGPKNEAIPGSGDDKRRSGEVDFKQSGGGAKSFKGSPITMTPDSRIGSGDNKKGANRWPMGEGDVKENVRKKG
jgi:hypothetical protein